MVYPNTPSFFCIFTFTGLGCFLQLDFQILDTKRY